jgi:glycerol kinase
VPESVLPEIRSSSEVYGHVSLGEEDFGLEGVRTHYGGVDTQVPISSAVGDQQASLIGQLCFDTGSAKCTYGTGCFLLVNTGNDMVLLGLMITYTDRYTQTVVSSLRWPISLVKNTLLYMLSRGVYPWPDQA